MNNGTAKTFDVIGKALLFIGLIFLIPFLLSFFGLSTRFDVAAAIVSFFDEKLTLPPFSYIPTYLSPFDGYTHMAFAAITVVCLMLDWICSLLAKHFRAPVRMTR